ncbi:MAG: hypothetical protein HQL14_05970 [Candidatus Omnitrophica bacterium]|nr:hypothetical protein [Candidatus Omnitrophota bacterium]
MPPVYLWGLVFLTVVPAVFYTYVLTPTHIIEDESYYQAAAKNILTSGHLGDLLKSQGWAFLVFLGYLLGGVNDHVSIHISQLLGSGAIVGIFFLAVWAGFSLREAFIAAAIFTFVPARMFWAATGESHTASIFFVIWAAAFSFLLYRTSERNIFWLAISVWVFAGLVRCETVVLFLFFILCIGLFLPKNTCKKFPFLDALFLAAIILMPQMILEIGTALRGHWVQTAFNISPDNFLHNAVFYGADFLNGHIHPVLLTLSAMLGLEVICHRSKRVAVVLAGWFFLLSITYFSLSWFGTYGNTTGIFLKTRLFVFFYPPLVLCAASAFVWAADRYAFGFKAIASAALCLGLIGWSILYYNYYTSRLDGFILQMKLVDEIGQTVSPSDMVVACFPDTLTSARLSSMATTDIDWFLQEDSWRRAAFGKAHKVYLVDDIFSQRRCQESVSLIKLKGKAVLVRQWTQGEKFFAVYSLSRF